MDPMTVVSFVASVVQLIDATSKAVNYLNDVKEAPKDRAKLAREATGLLSLFTDLRYRVEDAHSTDPWFSGLRSLGGHGGPLDDFKRAMDDLADNLVPVKGVKKFSRALRWTLDKKDVDVLLSKVERLKTLIGLALQNDHFKLSLAMKENVASGFEELRVSRDVEKICQWLAAPDPSSIQNTAQKRRQPTTGEWFTRSEDFTGWMIEPISFLWLHGNAGCGKTILCSTIIREVLYHCQSEPTRATAYFYFDFNDSSKQRTENLVHSLILQLSAQCQQLPESLQSAYSQSQNGQCRPTMETLTSVLQRILKDFNDAFIVLDALDALDECTDRNDLFEFLDELMGFKLASLHLLATSRNETDIHDSLHRLVTCQLPIQSAPVDADIRVHVLESLSKDPKLRKWPPNVQKEIENTLVEGAKGMFRWVVCQLDSLRKCLKLDTLRKALKTLPKDLDDTYERILANIDEEYEEDARKILTWLCFSARPIRVIEMVDLLAIDSTDKPRFRPEQRLPEPRSILIICSALVSVMDAGTGNIAPKITGTEVLRLAHFSVKEYLLSDRMKAASVQRYHILPSSASFSITKDCLAYLLYFENDAVSSFELSDRLPLICYAAEFWAEHYKSITDMVDKRPVDLLGYALVKTEKECYNNWLEIFFPYNDPFGLKRTKFERKNEHPLYCMSLLGVTGVVQLLLNEIPEVNTLGRAYSTALVVASERGHEAIARLLLEKGAEVNFPSTEDYSIALQEASREGHEAVVRLLLENNADVNAYTKVGGGTALQTASSRGHKAIVRLLLDKGADTNTPIKGDISTALQKASKFGHEAVVRLLLDKGADVNATWEGHGTALQLASAYGHLSIVHLLQEKGAHFN